MTGIESRYLRPAGCGGFSKFAVPWKLPRESVEPCRRLRLPGRVCGDVSSALESACVSESATHLLEEEESKDSA